MSSNERPVIAIRYCRQCGWLLRSTWYAQELLTTFADRIAEVALQPGTGGVFCIQIDQKVIWDRARDGGFPDVKELKQLVRNQIDPTMNLGHIDRASEAAERRQHDQQ